MRLLTTPLLCLAALALQAQPRVRDLFAQMPDSLCPLLTPNNRLDCLDMIESGREAKVKNRLDQPVRMTHLGHTHLRVEVSPRSVMEMKVLDDSTLCVIHTAMGPAPDSRIAFCSPQWTPRQVEWQMPAVAHFWPQVPDSVRAEAEFARRALEDIPLMEITANEQNSQLRLTLQTRELSGKEKEVAQQWVQPLTLRWTGQGFERQ